MSRPLRLAIDASRAARSQRAGTENYSYHLIGQLARQARPDQARLDLYTDRPLPVELTSGEAVEQHVIAAPRLWTHLRLSAAMLRQRPDVLFVPGHVLPAIHPPRTVVTVHDIGFLAWPELHPVSDRLYLDLSTRWNVRNATAIITPSQATADDLVRVLGVAPETIAVIPSGVDPLFSRPVTPQAVASMRQRRQIEGPYLLSVSTVHPRKNLQGLLAAFSQLRAAGYPHRLVVAGKVGWKTSTFAPLAEALGDAVLWAGYVPDDDLPALYAGADAFALPSLFEGFGFPVLEAMASGTPVLTSNTSSLPEVAGDAALLVDPLDASAIAAGLRRLIDDAPLRWRLIEAGRARAAEHSWQAAGAATLALLTAVATGVRSASRP